jgi:tRNA(fMet)-specific endonuclease VapC
MKLMLDTDICIHIIRTKPESLLERIQRYRAGDIAISAVTAGGLWVGVEKSKDPARNSQALTAFLAPLIIADFDHEAARSYGRLRATLESHGTPIGSLDMMIAAHALSLGIALVTNNERDFRRVHGLEVVNWTHDR